MELSLYGYGYGSGDGSGSGYGYGYVSGYGYGSGGGAGDGSQKKEYWGALLEPFKRVGYEVAFWRSTADGGPANGGSGTKAVEGATEEIQGPLQLCCRRALHATDDPSAWSGEHWWIVALHHPVAREGNKLGSLKRTFLRHLGPYPF